jgi:hypothetical protein
MTVMEFEGWISDNYEELVKRANIATKFNDDAVPLLHQVVEYVLEDPEKRIPQRPGGDLFGWFFVAMQTTRKANFRGQQIRAELFEQVASDIEVLGQGDAFADTRRAREANRKALKRKPSNDELGMGLQWDGPLTGNARWRYQQLRDGRLFDERALRSQAEAMHRASQRQRHDGWPGFSHTEFGTEEVAR